MHIPSNRDARWFEQLTAEHLVRVSLGGGREGTKWQPKTAGKRNEAIDCRVYALAALHGLRALGIIKQSSAPGAAIPGPESKPEDKPKQAAINLELSIRGVLRNFGLTMGKVAKGRFEARVRELTARNLMLEAAADPILRARAALRNELAGLEKLVRDHAKSDPVCRLMMTMPGVGAIVALTAKSAIDDPERFRSSKGVGAWVGLTPRREQSGERDIIGQITRAGDAGLRTALHQAAMVMLNHRQPNWLTAWALRVAKRRGKKRATVALARRIGVVLHRMWRDGSEFRFTRAVAMTSPAA